MNVLIENADVFTPEGLKRRDVAICGGIVRFPDGPGCGDLRFDERIDGAGKTLLPGLVDMHVHFREPGFPAKETIRGGCECAAAGGFTAVCTMPNLNPAPDSTETLEIERKLIEEARSEVRVLPYATITSGRGGREPVDYEALAPMVAGFSDDGNGVQSAEVMLEAMRGIAPTCRILAAHCEVDAMLDGGYIHKGTYAAQNGHKGICSESEWREIERDIDLAARTGCRLHICHVSTAEGVELVRQGRKSGVDVTCETAPHYLWFTDTDLRDDGRFKMNPPLRGIRDRDALIEGIADGTVGVIATDHAPHTPEEKSRGLKGSAMGVVGLETSFAAVYTKLCLELGLPFDVVVKAMSSNPRKILDAGRHGVAVVDGVTDGMLADLTLVDLNQWFTVNPERFHGKGRATPFEGVRLCGRPVRIFTTHQETWQTVMIHAAYEG